MKMDRLEEAMSSFAQCSATDCEHNDGGGCLCYTVDLVKKGGQVVCIDYDQRAVPRDKVFVVVLHDVEADWPNCEVKVFRYHDDAVKYLIKRGYLNDKSAWNWYCPDDHDFCEAHIEEHDIYD